MNSRITTSNTTAITVDLSEATSEGVRITSVYFGFYSVAGKNPIPKDTQDGRGFSSVENSGK
jgi:hypothetical protein